MFFLAIWLHRKYLCELRLENVFDISRVLLACSGVAWIGCRCCEMRFVWMRCGEMRPHHRRAPRRGPAGDGVDLGFLLFCCFLLPFVAICCLLLRFVAFCWPTTMLGQKLDFYVSKQHVENRLSYFFVCLLRCCWRTKMWEHKKQNFTGQNSNMSGVCGRLCSWLCDVATKMWEQSADFC